MSRYGEKQKPQSPFPATGVLARSLCSGAPMSRQKRARTRCWLGDLQFALPSSASALYLYATSSSVSFQSPRSSLNETFFQKFLRPFPPHRITILGSPESVQQNLSTFFGGLGFVRDRFPKCPDLFLDNLIRFFQRRLTLLVVQQRPSMSRNDPVRHTIRNRPG